MFRIGQLILATFFVALLIAAGSTLVTGPDGKAAPTCAIPEGGPLSLRAEGVPVEEAAPLRRMLYEERTEAVHTDHEEEGVTCPVVSDGNGWPVTGRTWTRTVYAVCPPEGMPG